MRESALNKPLLSFIVTQENSMRQPFVAGNWKMNGSRESVSALLAEIKAGLHLAEKAEIVVCAPYVFLGELQWSLGQGVSRIGLGAQNVCDHAEQGAYTGEVSADMLKEYGCQYVIVGHSERRAMYGETDEIVAAKFKIALEAGLKPILCVGELLEERESGDTETVVARQLDAVINVVGIDKWENSVIAYEPVWAIGTGKTATPEQAQDVHAFIRGRIAALNSDIADKMRILYGGSMKGSNAESLISMADIDGGLIGGASLKAAEFIDICSAAD